MEKKILLDELIEEIRIVLKDEFTAKIHTKGNGIAMEFYDGQKFRLLVTEIV